MAPLEHLARRNLPPDHLLGIPTGQTLVAVMRFAPLTAKGLCQGNPAELDAVLEGSGFPEATPCWCHTPEKAELREQRNSFGEVGTPIIAETFVGLLNADPWSILDDASEWTPTDGVGVATIAEMLPFAGVMQRVALRRARPLVVA